MKLIKLVLILLILVSCENVNDIAKLIRLGHRINRSTKIEKKNLPEVKLQNNWGLSTILKIDTINIDGVNYSVDLLLPIDTSQSVDMTIKMLPNMIANYADKESVMLLNFYIDSILILKRTIGYKGKGNNNFSFREL